MDKDQELRILAEAVLRADVAASYDCHYFPRWGIDPFLELAKKYSRPEILAKYEEERLRWDDED